MPYANVNGQRIYYQDTGGDGRGRSCWRTGS